MTAIPPDPIDAPATPRTRRRATSDTSTDARPRWRRWLKLGATATAVLAVLAAPWWGPPALSTLDFFHVRKVEFEGVRFSDPTDLMTRLALDTLASVWMPLEPVAERLLAHPLVDGVEVSRRLPGTVHVRVTERQPVALESAPDGMRVLAANGETLPIDPTQTPLDVPVAVGADSLLLRLLDRVRLGAPALWAKLSEARREGRDDVRLVLPAFDVRTRADVTVARLDDIFPVEADLTRRRLRPTELDLRFRDQVIARLP